jgi:hypothetical protein
VKPSLYLATPMQDTTVSAHHALSIQRLVLESAYEGSGYSVRISLDNYEGDLVRVRSRYAQDFLDGEATHLLWVDADIGFVPEAVRGMLRSGHDFVLTSYPRKFIDWEAVSDAANIGGRTAAELEARAYHHAVQTLPGSSRTDPQTYTVPIAGGGLGLCLMSRACVERLATAYRAELEFIDLRPPKQPRRTVAIFQLLLRDDTGGRALLSEDLSVAQRWRDLGGSVQLYVGPGAPASHAGPHLYRGYLEGLFAP